MIGPITGDIIGSVYEGRSSARTLDFSLFSKYSTFTDDTILTVAVADCILTGKDYIDTFKEYCRKYPDAGYGGRFKRWFLSESREPYNSYGNGSAMRVSPVAFAFTEIDTVLKEAKRTAEVTHNHPEGIKGAQAIAAAAFLAKQNSSKEEIRGYLETNFGYTFNKTLDEMKYGFRDDITCQVTVPEAVIVFLSADNFEDTVRKAIYIGGDADTIACMAGGIAQAYYKKIPGNIVKETKKILPPEFIKVIEEFERKFKVPS